MLVLEAGRLRELVSMHDAIGAVRDAFVSVAEGRADQPPRLVSRDGNALAMLARVDPADGTTFKAITITPANAANGLATIQAVALWFDAETGRPEALIEGSTLTALRTGAATGVATALLAPEDARVLAVVGAGAQARDQIDAVCAIRPVTEIRIVSRNGTSCRALVDRVAADRPTVAVRATRSVTEAVADADVVCCATNSRDPLFARADLKREVHVNAIGAYTPQMCELGSDVLAAAATVVVDEKAATLAEAGDVIQAIAAGAISVEDLVELGSLLAEPAQPKREGLTVFKSVGVAVQDWAVARLAYLRASERGDIRSIDLAAAIPAVPT